FPKESWHRCSRPSRGKRNASSRCGRRGQPLASSRRCCQNPCRKHGKEKTLLEHCCTSSRNKGLRCYRVRRSTEPGWKRSRRLGGAAAESAKRSHLKRRCWFRLAPKRRGGSPAGKPPRCGRICCTALRRSRSTNASRRA